MKKAMSAPALATHINANISVPIVAPMLISVMELVNAFRMMMNMAVATTDAAVTQIALKAVSSMIRNAAQRLKTERKTTNIMTKEKHAPARKSPNIHFDAVSMMWRMSVMSEGSETV